MNVYKGGKRKIKLEILEGKLIIKIKMVLSNLISQLFCHFN
jgi:hypothetical protein